MNSRGSWTTAGRTEGVLPSSLGLFTSCALQHMPQQTLHPSPPALPSSQTFREEGPINRYIRGKLKCCSGGRCTCVSANSPDSTKSSPSSWRIWQGHILGTLDCLQTCSGFFASSLAIIRLNKLSTLSLRLFPPLKPFERRDYFTDIYEGLVYMALGMYRSPCRPERSAGRTGGAGRATARNDGGLPSSSG